MGGLGPKRFTALIVTASLAATLMVIGCQSPGAGRTTSVSNLRGDAKSARKSVDPVDFTANDRNESHIQPLGSPDQGQPTALTKFLNRFKPKKKRIPLPLSETNERQIDAGEELNEF